MDTVSPAEEWAAFVGGRADYYVTSWKRLIEQKRVFSFNWAAAFFSALWLGYRKMYGLAALTVGLALFASLLADTLFIRLLSRPTPGVLNPVLSFTIGAIFGCFGNLLYLKHAEEAIARLEGLPDRERIKQLSHRGGTSLVGVLLVPLMALAMGVLVGLVAW